MFGVIVVGTDGSETASAAVTKAVEIAAVSDATLHIVHAHRLVSAGQMGQAAARAGTFDMDQVNRGSRTRASILRTPRHAEAAGVKTETHVTRATYDVLRRHRRQVADLVVVGNRDVGVRRRPWQCPQQGVVSLPGSSVDRRHECDGRGPPPLSRLADP